MRPLFITVLRIPRSPYFVTFFFAFAVGSCSIGLPDGEFPKKRLTKYHERGEVQRCMNKNLRLPILILVNDVA